MVDFINTSIGFNMEILYHQLIQIKMPVRSNHNEKRNSKNEKLLELQLSDINDF